MSKTDRLIMRNDGCSADYIKHFGTEPDDESRKKVLDKLSSFLLDNLGKPVVDLTKVKYDSNGPKEFKHPAVIGFDLAIHAAGKIILGYNSENDRPYSFGFYDQSTIDPVIEPEKSYEAKVALAQYNGFTYGLNVLSRYLDYSKFNGGLDPEYRFHGLEPVAVSDNGQNVMLAQPLSYRNRIFPESGVRHESELFPSGFAGTVPSNLDRMIQFAVLPRLVAETYLLQVGQSGVLLDSRNLQKTS